MRLAAIDVGSNSVHMVVADVDREGHVAVVDRVKEMVRLGRRAFVTGFMTAEAMDLAVRALTNFARLAWVRKVDRVRAVATAAVREARNRAAFIRRIKRETGLSVEVISGAEEARLVFEAARHALGLDGGPHLLVDLGGGSLELVAVRDGHPLWSRSFRLGAARLTERFLVHDPPTGAEARKLRDHLDEEIGAPLAHVRKLHVKRAIGTSGTVNMLVAMARAARGDELGRLHGAAASAGEIEALLRRLLACDLEERAALPGADAKRADLMPAVGVLADFVLSRAEAPELVACGWALREGLLLEMAGRVRRRGAGEARRRSVSALATRFAGANTHGRHVAKLALALFDSTAPALGLPTGSRELLEYAALLHDIGHIIDHDRHNRHSYYLILNADLLGFDAMEIEVLAQTVRAHRKQAARLDSPELRALPDSKRHLVRGLAAILRVADALDRSHVSVVKDMDVRYGPGRLVVTVNSEPGAADLEIWACERRTDLLSKLLSRQVIVRPRASLTPLVTSRNGTRTDARPRATKGSPTHSIHVPGA